MTFRQLEAFLALVRERSFGRAAARIHLSQPTLSEHIRELERELGKRLFARRGREVTLTEAGRVFQPHALRVATAAEDGRQAVAHLDGLGHGSLTVGASTTPGIYVLPRVIATFHRRYPGIDLALHVANSGVIEQRVRDGDVDLGVVGGHVLGPGERCVAAGLVDELILIAPPGHRWARGGPIPGDELGRERMLVREAGSATRHVMERALQQAGLRAGATMELNHTEAIKECVMAGLGVAFVSSHAVRGEVRAGALVVVRVRRLRIRRHFHVIHAEGRSLPASGRAFLAVLEAEARRPGARG
jgi:DNA-binding transcriptional LysR family regulator